MKQLIIGLKLDLENDFDDYFFKIIKDKEIIYADEFLEDKDIIDRFNIKFLFSHRKFENINDKNEKIKEFDEIITCIDGHIYVYFKGKDY